MKLAILFTAALFPFIAQAAGTNYCDQMAHKNKVLRKNVTVANVVGDGPAARDEYETVSVVRDKKGRVVTLSQYQGSGAWEDIEMEYDSTGACIPTAQVNRGTNANNPGSSFQETVRWDLETCKKLSNMESELKKNAATCNKIDSQVQSTFQSSRMIGDMEGMYNSESLMNEALVALDRCKSDPVVAKMVKDQSVGSYLYGKAKKKSAPVEKEKAAR